MLNKKVKAILFMFLILFCISAVNAESNDTNTDVQSVDIIDVKSDSYVAAIDDATKTTGNFSALNKTVNGNNGNSVTLDRNYTYNDSTDEDFKEGILINRTVTIDGNGFTIDGNHTARIFNVTENGTLTLKNIILVNGNATFGGAIYNLGTLDVINVTFISNNATTMEGGAICNDGNVSVANSTFINNTAEAADGGAIYSFANMSVENSTFINNRAYCGGAIFTETNVTVRNSKFINNKAEEGEGGAIFIFESSISLINSTFINNTSLDGGAIYGDESNVTVIDSKFIKNNATYDEGGAIYADFNITVINSLFINNTAGYEGGAIFGHMSNVNIINSSFINNTAVEGDAGAIYCGEDANIINSSFINNTAEMCGAALIEGIAYIVNSSFINNTGIEEGGAVYCEDEVTVINSEFINNKLKEESEGGGGAIYADGKLTIINSTFNNNSALSMGGAIYCEDEVIVINSTFIDNKLIFEYYAYGGGAAICSNNVTVINSTFTNNTIIFKGEEEEEEEDYCGGGAIYTYDDIIIINSTFINNTAMGYSGGAIYSEDGNINITNSTFVNNMAKNGGAIYGISNITVTDSKFFDNNATRGGAICYKEPEEECTLTVTGSTFEGNTGEYGDDIYTDHNTTLLNNSFSRSSYANIYANNTIIDCSVISALENTTYYVLPNSTFKVYAIVLADGASINGYNITIKDKENNTIYNTTYVGYGKYESTVNITADFKIRPYTANLTVPEELEGEDLHYIIQDGLVSTEKQNITIEVQIDDNVFGESLTGNVTLKDANGKIANFTGEVTVEVDGKNYTVNITNGTGNFEIDDQLGAGNHSLTVKFNETEAYNSANETFDFEIAKANPDLDVNVTDINGNLTMDIIMNPDINGNVTVIIGNETIVVEIRNGTGKLVLDDLESGVHNFTVSFEGNDNYNQAEAKGEFDVDKGILLEVDELTKYYGSEDKLNIRVRDGHGNPIANQTVTITINGVTYTRTTDENGNILMNINLIPGVYEAEVTYENMTEKVNVTVISTIESEDLIKYFKNGSQFYAKFLDVDGTPLANTNVTFNVHGVLYTRTTDENGVAKLNINLNPGEYIITAINPVNNEYKSNVITVLTTIIGENVIKYFKNGTQYYAYVLDLDGNPLVNGNVTFNIHGVFYTRQTNEEGIVKLNINLNPGEYIITAWNPVNNESYSNNITVLNVVESSDLEMTTSARKPFTVTILGDHGAPLANAEVTFNIHGVFYHKTTDANGQISLDINLIAGKYIITTYFNTYSVSNTIIVK